MVSLSRRAFALGAMSALAGCTGLSGSLSGSESSGSLGSSGRADTSSPAGETVDGSASAGSNGSGPPLADRRLHTAFESAFLRDQVRSGGPGKDGIPSIDEPMFASAQEAPVGLGPDSIVFGIVHDEAVKAYPQYVLVWHEIVNDVLGDRPVSVTYCPLTGTAMGFLRGETTFGVSGKLLNSNLVMYDRATDSRWPQMLATAISGPLVGNSLREFSLAWTTWRRWRREYPETLVLTEDTGHIRDYGRDPYGAYTPPSGYYAEANTLFAPLRESDRYHPKSVAVGTRTAEGALAFHKPALRKRGLLEGTASAATETATGPETEGGTPYLAAYDPELDTATVYYNPDERAFEYRSGRVVGPDGTVHAPDALSLERVVNYDAMWFAWAGFYPNSTVVE